MDTTRKELQTNSCKFWELERRLGIPLWKNSLSLPETDRPHTLSEIKLEQDLEFTFTEELVDQSSKTNIFVSEQTNFLGLCQYLPFLSEKYQLYICSHRLIRERVSSLDHNESFIGDNKATRQLNFILQQASSVNASDIHIESMPGKKTIRLRIDGELQPLMLEDDIEDYLFSKIKLISEMDIAQKRSPQDGHFPYTCERGKRYDMRTSTVPGVHGEKIVIRLLPAASVRFSMDELGFLTSHIPIIQDNIHKKTGMILFTGPTGSGKTTSLYAILNELNSKKLNILTIEDPVEYRMENITQVEVNELSNVSFSSALRSFLRQDPDVILVGEIRDQETAQIAARAAQTGHLVLSTLHSNNVFEAIHRLKTLGVEGDDLASSLSMIVSQRLVSHLCACGNNASCKNCSGRGVYGRIPVMEVLDVTSQIRRLLSYGNPISDIEKQAYNDGFISLKSVGEKLVDKGSISLSELETICHE